MNFELGDGCILQNSQRIIVTSKGVLALSRLSFLQFHAPISTDRNSHQWG